MRVAIHQPEHLPWLGLLDKISGADLFVLLDTVQFRKNYFQNRNRIRTPGGWAWATLPVCWPVRVPLADIRIVSDPSICRHYLNLVQNHYRQAPHFDHYFPQLREALASGGDRLVPINRRLLEMLLSGFRIKTPMVLASELGIPAASGGTEVNLSICRFLGADSYLSGISGREYLDAERFAQAGIRLEFQEFHHPVYPQLHPGFVPRISALEALFLFGPAAGRLLQPEWKERLEAVFT